MDANILNSFNWKFYLYVNTDLKNYSINTKKDAFIHFLNNGFYENRTYTYDLELEKEFDEEIYILFNDDLPKNEEFSNLYHWILYGRNEKRIYNLLTAKESIPGFNWIKYLFLNKDLLDYNIIDERNALIHYVKKGIRESRNHIINKEISDKFNWINYVSRNNLNNIKNCKEALEHYLGNELNEYVNVKLFNNIKNRLDVEKYIENYPQLNDIKKHKIFSYWFNKGNYEKHIFYNKLNKNKIKSDFGIAVTVYSDEHTPIERIHATYIFLNSLLLNFVDNYILILIDNKIDSKLLNHIYKIRNYYHNIKIYINKKNYGISKSKNICLSLMSREEYLSYYCLLDDDVDIIENFEHYCKKLITDIKIPILSNFNKNLSFKKYVYKNNDLIKTKHYLGNILVLKKFFFKKYGYFNKFYFRWGEEHLEITKRYLKKTEFRNKAVDFREYINDSVKINNIDTLNLHSCIINKKGYIENKKQHKKYLKKIKYVDFDFDIEEIKEL